MQYQTILETLSDFWIMSGRIVTAISLLVLPLLVVGYVFFTREIIIKTITFDRYYHIHSTIPYVTYFLDFFIYFQIFAFIVILLLYPPYPLPFPSRWYFEKRGYSRAVKEYQFVKNVLIVTVPFLIIFTVIGALHDLTPFSQEGPISANATGTPLKATANATGTPLKATSSSPLKYYMDIIHPHIDTFDIATIVLFLIVVSGVLKMIFARARREFWLYYARGCFVQMQDAKNEMDEIRYLVSGLNSYNLYIRRQTKLEIKQLSQVFSKIASLETVKKNDFIGKLAFFFSSDTLVKNNTLNPLKEISKLLNTSESELLVGQSLKNRLMEWGAAAAVFIPLTIQTVTFITPFFGSH
jgi:hypothetical protein